MATSKMEKIEKLKDEMTRASLVRCQAASHVSKIEPYVHNIAAV